VFALAAIYAKVLNTRPHAATLAAGAVSNPLKHRMGPRISAEGVVHAAAAFVGPGGPAAGKTAGPDRRNNDAWRRRSPYTANVSAFFGIVNQQAEQ
jgi:hypothetical protein